MHGAPNTSAMVHAGDLGNITADSSAACGYSCLGVSGGEGSMIVGDAKYVLAATSSLDRNLNGCGICKSAACNGDCTVDSPATDNSWNSDLSYFALRPYPIVGAASYRTGCKWVQRGRRNYQS